jgi:hypothetical protein
MSRVTKMTLLLIAICAFAWALGYLLLSEF